MVSGQHIQIGKSTQGLLEDPDYSEWTTEELIQGRRRDRNGKYRGRPPKVIPLSLLHELNRRRVPEVMRTMVDAALPAAKYLASVARGDESADQGRITTCNIILNRILGQVPQRIQLQEVAETPWERAGVGQAIVLRNAIDAESDEWDNPYEDEATKAARDKEDALRASRARALPSSPAVDPWEDETEDNPFEDTANPIVEGRPTRK